MVCIQNKQNQNNSKSNQKKSWQAQEKITLVNSIYLLNNWKNDDEKLINQSHMNILHFQ